MKPLLAGHLRQRSVHDRRQVVSFYFSPLVSMPFVPGHEIVGELLDDCDDLPSGTRVVMGSVLSCAARGETAVPELRRRRRRTVATASRSAT